MMPNTHKQTVANTAARIVPVEVWMLIVNFLFSVVPIKYIVPYRRVCKLWRDIIDEKVIPQFILNDKNDNSSVGHLVVEKCIVTKFNSLATNFEIFRNTTKLSTLCLWGEILPKNLTYLTESLNFVKIVSINGSSMKTKGLILQPHSLNSKNFWLSLSKLEISGIHLTQENSESHETNNFLNLLLINMSQLESLILEINFTLTFHLKKIIDFLNRTRQIKFLKIRLCGTSHVRNELIINEQCNFQLETLILEASSCQEIRKWMPTLIRQTSLKHFRVTVKSFLSEDWSLYDALIKVVLLNQSTITTLELRNFYLPVELNMNQFEYMHNLKKLELGGIRSQDNISSRILNINKLPNGIQKLVLNNISSNAAKDVFHFKFIQNLKLLEINKQKFTS